MPALTRSCPMLTPGTSTSSRRLRSVFGGASTAVGSGANRRSTMSVLKRMPLTVSVSGIGRVDSTTSVCGSNFVETVNCNASSSVGLPSTTL